MSDELIKSPNSDGSVKEVRQVCKCENCGSEAEMIITCSLPPSSGEEKRASASPVAKEPPKKREKGKAVCTHCGNEADMWIDL
jgi:thymidine kinase